LAIVGLTGKEKNFPSELSGGEQQRVSVARAIVHRPKLLIADEPTGNLDPETARGIMELLLKINERGTTIILATHDKEMVDFLQRRVVKLKDGIVVSDREKAGYE
jgi:cell division transport system ATP-binding protein